MLDIDIIRKNPALVKKGLQSRGYNFDIDELVGKDSEWKHLKEQADSLRHRRNVLSAEIKEIISRKADAKEKIAEVKIIPEQIKSLEVQAAALKQQIDAITKTLPNLPDASAPYGQGAEDNKTVRQRGKIPKFKFKPKDHAELGKELDILDLERSAKLAGSGFYVFKGLGATLERALINFMLDFHIKDGWVEVFPPELVNEKTMFGTGQLPKFENDLFKTREGLYLIPTAEVPLTNLHAAEVLNPKELPKRYCAYTPCFRTEAGKHGEATRGIFRLHQFDKVEMVVICKQEDSAKELESMRSRAERLLELLEIPYRTILLCTGDMGFASAKTYDIECYASAMERYLETSSCSNCADFQARRMNTKYFTPEGTKFVHTLNGSGLALPRLMIALLENNQQKDGSIKIPKVLIPYMRGIKEIRKAVPKPEKQKAKPKKAKEQTKKAKPKKRKQRK